MAWPTYKPPGGFVYKPASGSPGCSSSAGPAKPYSAEHQAPPEHKSIGQMEAREYKAKLAEKHAKALQAYDDAWESGNAGWAMTATKQWEARMYGDPKQVVETQGDTRTDEEILADIERRKRELGV